MYGFLSSNALYSASLWFRMFFFFTPSDTSGSYYFELNISQVLLVKVLFIKKHATLFFSLLGWRNIIAPSLFLCLFGISMGWYWRKNLAKSGGFGKKYKKGDGYTGGIQTFCTQWIFFLSLKRRNLQNNRMRSLSTFRFWFSNEISIFPLIFALLADSWLALDNYWGGGIIITKLITSFLYSIFEFKG